MENIKRLKFKRNWLNRVESMFWDKINKTSSNLFLTYMFDFCSLRSDVKSDEVGHLYLCYSYEKKKESENNLLLQKIFIELFGEFKNEKYIGYYKLKREEDYRDVLMALFILGNQIEDENLKFILLEGNTKSIFENFQKTGLTSDELLDMYINDIVSELDLIALNTKNKIYDNVVLNRNSENFWNFPFLKAT